MNDPYNPLTPAVQQLICSYVRAGAFPHVAAEAAGVPQKVFERWMRCGKAKRPVPHYRDFALSVMQAQAEARVTAESKALLRAPLSWLRFGPGRETSKSPGWTGPARPATPNPRNSGLSSGRLAQLFAVMLEALTPFPEAREALAQMLDETGWTSDPAAEQQPASEPLVQQPAPSSEAAANPDGAAEQKTAESGCTAWQAPAADALNRMETKQMGPAPRSWEEASPEGAFNWKGCRGEAAWNLQAACNEPATNRQSTGNKTAAKPPRMEREDRGTAAKPARADLAGSGCDAVNKESRTKCQSVPATRAGC